MVLPNRVLSLVRGCPHACCIVALGTFQLHVERSFFCICLCQSWPKDSKKNDWRCTSFYMHKKPSNISLLHAQLLCSVHQQRASTLKHPKPICTSLSRLACAQQTVSANYPLPLLLAANAAAMDCVRDCTMALGYVCACVDNLCPLTCPMIFLYPFFCIVLWVLIHFFSCRGYFLRKGSSPSCLFLSSFLS